MNVENKEIVSEHLFLNAAETAQLLHISKSHAYKLIHRLNHEMKDMGFITIAGRINRQYLMERTAGRQQRKEAQHHGSLQG